MADRPHATRPHRYSLVAAAEVVTSRSVKRPVKPVGMMAWQEEAWRHYDTVGEFRFGVSWQSNALSRVNLVAAIPPQQVGDEPTAIDTSDENDDLTPAQQRAVELTEQIAGGPSGQGQLLGEFGQHLSVAGLGWLVAEPSEDRPDEYATWGVFAQDSLKFEQPKKDPLSGEPVQSISVRVGPGESGDSWRTLSPDALVVKAWRKHPRRWWEPDSPVRAVLGVLDIIDLLTAHITASGRSRLAGAGVFAVPAEAEFPPPPPKEGDDPDTAGVTEQDAFDYFVEQLTVAMTTPITDRDNASAVVPVTVAIPGEYLDKLKHITFSTPFDDKVQVLLDEAIKRLALGLDMPPEVLTGMAGVNHWTAWQVEDTAITLHVEPPAEIVCNALTEGWLRPALEAEGLDPDTAIVWYETSDLTSPPDKSGNAQALYDRIQLSAMALRRESGFTEEDKPDDDEFRRRVLLDAAKGAPTLAPAMLAAAGILEAEVADAADDAEAGGDESPADAEAPESETPTETPPPADDRPSQAAALDSLLMACDGIVDRAMERAGNRLRSSVGKKAGGPQALDRSIDARVLHLSFDPTVYADLDYLLAESFDRVPTVAEYLDIDADALVATLRSYCRGLLATQHEHDLIRLSGALGADALV